MSERDPYTVDAMFAETPQRERAIETAARTALFERLDTRIKELGIAGTSQYFHRIQADPSVELRIIAADGRKNANKGVFFACNVVAAASPLAGSAYTLHADAFLVHPEQRRARRLMPVVYTWVSAQQQPGSWRTYNMGELADGPLISEVEDNVFIRDWTEPQLQQRERARPQNLSRVSGDSDQTVAALLLNRLGVLREDDADRDKYIIPLGF